MEPLNAKFATSIVTLVKLPLLIVLFVLVLEPQLQTVHVQNIITLKPIILVTYVTTLVPIVKDLTILVSLVQLNPTEC